MEDLTITDNSPSPEDRVITKEMYRKAYKVLQELEEPYRDVFILHAIGEVSLKEVATVYGKTESWARVTYFRARQKILQEVSV